MAEDQLDWGPNVNYNIYTGDYHVHLVRELRRKFGENNRTAFITRNGKKYGTVTLENNKNQGLVCHAKEQDFYITAFSKSGGGVILRFDDDDFDDFGIQSSKLGFKGNYTDLTRTLDDKIYSISYQKFVDAVEFLIKELYGTSIHRRNTKKWKKSMFIVVMALGEGGRNKIISSSYAKSQLHKRPSETPGTWVNYVIQNWSAFSNSARLCEDQNLTFEDLTVEEKDMIYALEVPADSYQEHLKKVKANHRVCRVMLAILCKEKPIEKSSKGSS